MILFIVSVSRRYSIAVSMSGALYTAIPLLVSILTFTSYIALGNTLDVATALTSLALFDLLRFPLFMLPQVINHAYFYTLFGDDAIKMLSNF